METRIPPYRKTQVIAWDDPQASKSRSKPIDSWLIRVHCIR